MEKKTNHKHNFGNIVAIILIVLFITIFLFVVFYQKTTKTAVTEQPVSQTVIICNRNRQEYGDFLYTENPTSVKISIKSIFKNNTLSEINLNYLGTYSSESTASSAESKIHNSYNIFLGEQQVDIEAFNPSYTIIDNTVSMNLYTKVQDQRNSLYKISNVFYLNQNTDIASMSSADLRKNYAAAGFSCAEE